MAFDRPSLIWGQANAQCLKTMISTRGLEETFLFYIKLGWYSYKSTEERSL